MEKPELETYEVLKYKEDVYVLATADRVITAGPTGNEISETDHQCFYELKEKLDNIQEFRKGSVLEAIQAYDLNVPNWDRRKAV